MSWRAPTLLTFLLFLLFPLAASFNITRILGRFPEFSTFNSLLSQTHLASNINSRNTITVLAVGNHAIMSVAGRTVDDLGNILAVHVLLDYFDTGKIHELHKHPAFVTTLFQTTGLATGLNGFLNVTNLADGHIAFGSAEEGSTTANFTREVVARPYNISVLQVNGVIVPPGLGEGPQIHTSPPAPKGRTSPAPAPSGPAGSPNESPSPSPSTAPAPTRATGLSPSGPPAASVDGEAGPSPSMAPAGPSPITAPAASKDAGPSPSKAPPSRAPPKGSTPPPDDDSPPADEDHDDGSNAKSSATRRTAFGAGVAGAVAFAMLALP